jgi:hypothetical protein
MNAIEPYDIQGPFRYTVEFLELLIPPRLVLLEVVLPDTDTGNLKRNV